MGLSLADPAFPFIKAAWAAKLEFLPAPFGLERECYLWGGALGHNGYPLAHVGGKKGPTVRVHRWLFKQVFPTKCIDGLDLDHLCRRKTCINVDHLEPTTHFDNLLRSTFWERARNGAVVIAKLNALSDDDLAALADPGWAHR